MTQIHEPLCLRLEGGQTDLFRRSSLWDVVVWFYSHRMLTYFDVTLQACSAKVLKNYQTLHVGDCRGNHNFMDDHTDHTFIFIHVCRCILYPAPDCGTVTAWGVVSDSLFLYTHTPIDIQKHQYIYLQIHTHTRYLNAEIMTGFMFVPRV